MKVEVTKERVLITESVAVNENELNVNLCDFVLPECFQGLTVTATFNNIPVPLTGAQCYIPSLKSGTAILGVYAYRADENGELSLMYSPKPACFCVNKGSYSEKTAVEEIPTISEFERYCATVSALTFPKSNVIGGVDLESEFDDTQVYSARALNLALEEVGNVLGNYDEDISLLKDAAEKTSNKVTDVNERSTNTQYPSAAAVYKGLCKQAEKTEQTKFELLSAMNGLSKDIATNRLELEEAVNGVDNRVTNTVKSLGSVISEQNELNSRIIDLQESGAQMQNRADDLYAEIQGNKGDISGLNTLAESVQSDLQNVRSSVDNLRDMVSSRVTDNANSIKGNMVGAGYVEIKDVSPIAHYLNVSVEGNAATDVIVCRGKNMLGFNDRTLASFELGNHTFTGENMFLSIAGNGIYRQDTGTYSFDEAEQSLTIGCERSWFGLGLDYKITGNSKYIVSVESVTDGFAVVASFYDSDGNYINYISGVENKAFTTPANAEWMIIIFAGKTKDTTGEFFKPQLETGDTATEYQPYVETRYATADSNGRINDFISQYPVTILSSDNPAVNISCVYNKDTNKAYKALVEAITALGGSV